MIVEEYAIQQINTLIPKYEKLEIELYIDDVSYSIDFFVTFNGQRKQCLDLIDENIISNQLYEEISKRIAEFARNSNEYKKGKINKYHALRF